MAPGKNLEQGIGVSVDLSNILVVDSHSLCRPENSAYSQQLTIRLHSCRRSRYRPPDDHSHADVKSRPRDLCNDLQTWRYEVSVCLAYFLCRHSLPSCSGSGKGGTRRRGSRSPSQTVELSCQDPP